MSKIKGNAATKAAGKVNAAIEAANAEIKAIANEFTTWQMGAVGKKQLECALKAREVVERVPDADIKPLISAFGPKRKAECNAIVYASDGDLMAANELFPKSRKPGLQQMARALLLVKARAETGKWSELEAKRYINKGAKADFLAATGQEEKTPDPAPTPDPVPVQDDEPDQKRDVQLPAPVASEVGNIKRLADLMPALESELKEYGPECQKAFKAFKAAADKLIAATANG